MFSLFAIYGHIHSLTGKFHQAPALYVHITLSC